MQNQNYTEWPELYYWNQLTSFWSLKKRGSSSILSWKICTNSVELWIHPNEPRILDSTDYLIIERQWA